MRMKSSWLDIDKRAQQDVCETLHENKRKFLGIDFYCKTFLHKIVKKVRDELFIRLYYWHVCDIDNHFEHNQSSHVWQYNYTLKIE